MKLAVRRSYFGDRLCFPDVVPHAFLDVQAAYARKLEVEGEYREDAVARAQHAIPAQLPALLRDDPDLGLARSVQEWALNRVAKGDLLDGCTWNAPRALIGSPVGSPRMVWGMSANYERTPADPAAPAPAPDPDARGLRGFLKAPGAMTGPYDDVFYPGISQRVEPELELAVVVGRRSRGLDRENAMSAVAGYVACFDITARDVVSQDRRMGDRGKGFDTFAVVGPWFVTADEVADPYKLRIRTWVNGKPRQDALAGEMLHDIPAQLCWLSAALTLRPGDLLSTGSPAGVAPVAPGDVMSGEIEGLGEIENRVVSEPALVSAVPPGDAA